MTGNNRTQFLSLLVSLIFFTGCSLSGTMKMHDQSPAKLLQVVEFEDAGAPYLMSSGDILTVHYSSNSMTFVRRSQLLDPIDSLTVKFPERINHIASILTPDNKFLIITGKHQRKELHIYGTSIDISGGEMIEEQPLLTGLSWDEVAESHKLYFRWNQDTTKFALVHNKSDKEIGTQLEGMIFNSDLKVETILDDVAWNWKNDEPVKVKEITFDGSDELGVVLSRLEGEIVEVWYEQVTSNARNTWKTSIPAQIDRDEVYVSYTSSAIDSTNHLNLIAFVSDGDKDVAFATMRANLNQVGEVQKNLTYVSEESVDAMIGVKGLYNFQPRCSYLNSEGNYETIAEYVEFVKETETTPEKKVVTETRDYDPKTGKTTVYKSERTVSQASSKDVSYYRMKTILRLTVDTEGEGDVAISPLVQNRVSSIAEPDYRPVGPQLLDIRHRGTSLQLLNDNPALLYYSNGRSFDMSYVLLSGEEGEEPKANPLVKFSGIGAIWSANIISIGNGRIIIPALTSLGGRGALFVVEL